ncbi:MAG: 7TM diverse intracellular signaling domain-containing protein, partial [Cytophagaceae bacterium]
SEQFMGYALSEYYLLGIFYGILLIMAIYNFFLYFSTREKVYLYYVAYVICYCFNAFKEDGTGFQFLWPSSPWFNPFLDSFSSMFLILSFVFYSKSFLALKNYAFRLNQLLNISMIIYVGAFFLNFYFDFFWMLYLYLLPFAIIYLGGALAWKKGNRSAKYFLFAFSFLALCFTLYVMRLAGIVETSIYTVYILNFGFLIEVVLFSYALGQKLKIEKEEKIKVDKALIQQLKKNEKLKDDHNKKLESKVALRTKELAEALDVVQVKNRRIEELNELLQKDNQILTEDIKDITKARLMLKDLTFDEFKKIYPVEEACLKYLADIKWGNSYKCKKCGNPVCCAGKTLHSKRCTKCGYDESVTSYTLFHKSKIPITTTFYLTYLILANKDISSHELSEKLGLRQKTCWAFKRKVLDAIANSNSPKLTSKEWGKIFYS